MAKRRAASRRGGALIEIAVINHASDESISPKHLAKVVAALQKQVMRDFAPIWGVAARLSLVPPGKAPPHDAWWLTLHDDSDRADDLGYHDLTSTGLPLGKAFVATARADGMPWSVVLSHELLEMLIDPYINLAAFIRNSPRGLLYGYEVCDPCRSDSYRIDGIAVANFVYPAWFEAPRPRRGTRFDHLQKVAAPLQLRPGGYAIFNGLGDKRGWRTKTAGAGRARSRLRPGSRLARRAAAKTKPRPSQPRHRKR